MTELQQRVLAYLDTVIAADVEDITEDMHLTTRAATNAIRTLLRDQRVIIASPRQDTTVGGRTLTMSPLYAKPPA